MFHQVDEQMLFLFIDAKQDDVQESVPDAGASHNARPTIQSVSLAAALAAASAPSQHANVGDFDLLDLTKEVPLPPPHPWHEFCTIQTRGRTRSDVGRPLSDGAEEIHENGIDIPKSPNLDQENDNFRRSRTLTFRRRKKPAKEQVPKESTKKRRGFWSTFRFKKKLPASLAKLKKPKDHVLPEPVKGPEPAESCVCTGYRTTDEHVLGAGVVFDCRIGRRPIPSEGATGGLPSLGEGATAGPRQSTFRPLVPITNGPFMSHEWVHPLRNSIDIDDREQVNAMLRGEASFPPPQELLDELAARDLELAEFADSFGDIDEIRMLLRRRDMENGIDVVESPMGYKFRGGSPRHSRRSSMDGAMSELAASVRSQCSLGPPTTSKFDHEPGLGDSHGMLWPVTPAPPSVSPHTTVHTQVDYIHCLVPDLPTIANCPCYWGVMDRYEAEKLLEGKPEGTFLLRDSAQEEFLFSVSFRRYNRSLHARIEQWNHKFSFDSHDPGVYAADTVCGLIEHYKDPSCCMFFEPMLTRPLFRNFPFSLQHLCRSVICGNVTYDGVNNLPLPKSMRQYLKYYHYKQKVRVRRFECPA